MSLKGPRGERGADGFPGKPGPKVPRNTLDTTEDICSLWDSKCIFRMQIWHFNGRVSSPQADDGPPGPRGPPGERVSSQLLTFLVYDLCRITTQRLSCHIYVFIFCLWQGEPGSPGQPGADGARGDRGVPVGVTMLLKAFHQASAGVYSFTIRTISITVHGETSSWVHSYIILQQNPFLVK